MSIANGKTTSTYSEIRNWAIPTVMVAVITVAFVIVSDSIRQEITATHKAVEEIKVNDEAIIQRQLLIIDNQSVILKQQAETLDNHTRIMEAQSQAIDMFKSIRQGDQ